MQDSQLHLKGFQRQCDIPPQEDRPQNPDEGGSDSAGRWGKHQTYAVQLIDLYIPSKEGVQYPGRVIQYGAMLPDLTFEPGQIVILYQNKVGVKDGVAQAIIEGSNLQRIVDHLSEGKRLSIKVNVFRDAVGKLVYPQKKEEPVVERITFSQLVGEE